MVASPAPLPIASVISVSVVSPDHAASILRNLYPRAHIRVERGSNSIIVVALPDDVQAMRSIVQGIDVRNPTLPTLEVIALHAIKAGPMAARLRPLYPGARISLASQSSLLVRATPLDMAQIKSLISNLDQVPATPPPINIPAEAVKVTQSNPRDVARAIARQLPHLRASVAGSSIILVGGSDDITKAKSIIASIDQPAFGSKYTQVYHIKNIDATSLADLLKRSFGGITVTVDKDLNALSVFASGGQQQRIADAIAQLDATGGPAVNGSTGGAAYGNGNIDVVELRSAMPGAGQGQASTTANDIAQAVTQSLQQMAPDLRVTVPANSTEIVLSGSPQSIHLARELINRLDRTPPLVVLDTEVLEVDENSARNIGLQFPGAQLTTVFSEMQPSPNPITGLPGRIIGLQTIGRTALQFSAALNLLVQRGSARVLADPRITTISGHTATIRAGDQISVLTQTAGGPGTPVTQQIQSFQTGVTLDITPIVNGEGQVTVALHPVVNSLSGIVNTIPQIATRDTQTVVSLRDGETLAIGGLIQEQTQKSSQRIPVLGELPLIGGLFRSDSNNYNRNELIIVVTPHILQPGSAQLPPPNAVLQTLPTPQALPTLPPSMTLPSPLPQTLLTPQPISMPIPAPSVVPSGSGASLHTPLPSISPSPGKTPSAFASANVFEYGSAPQSTFATEQDNPQIFYASYSPTIVRQGTEVTVSAITSTNVKRVTIGIPGYTTSLSQIAPSKWQATYPFNTSGIVSSQSTVTLTLYAFRADGATAAIQIPVSLLTSP